MTIGDPQSPAEPGCRPSHYLFVAVAFAAAYGQAALYYSNQNQYFLHGFALANQGLLGEDWLANTLDPTPIFSQFTAWTAAYLQPWVFHVYLAVLMGIYAAAMLDVFAVLAGPHVARRHWLAFAFLLVLIHSAALRWCSTHWLGPLLPEAFQVDYPWYFQAGVASQYLLGAMFQPSVFGVLLLAGLAFFLRDRLVLSSLCVAAAGTMHNTYLLPGAMLTAGFLAQLTWERRYRAGLLVGLLTLALVLPTAIYSARTFGPTSPDAFAAAQDLLANFRIPHHCQVDYWLDPIAVLQILWVMAAVALVWKTRLFAVMALCVALSSGLTVVQVVTGSDFLALLFPWRISALLVPLATTVVLSRLIGTQRASHVSGGSGPPASRTDWQGSPPTYVGGSLANALAALGMLALAAAGIGISVERMAFQSPVEDVPLMRFVRDHNSKGDVYLLPVKKLERKKVPTAAIRSLSSDFKADKAKDSRFIPLDLQQFRLHAETPIFVDFKSIPYKDVEVIEWSKRLQQASEWQESIKKSIVPLRELRERHVTHLVRPAAERELTDPGLRLIYPVAGNSDPRYRVYELVK